VKIRSLVVALVMMFSIGCGDNSEQLPAVEVFSGELEVKDLQDANPYTNTSIDSVAFTVEGNQYFLKHITFNSGLCSSGGTVDNFGSNLIRLIRVFIIPKFACDSSHVPQGQFKAAFKGDSLRLGPDTIEYVVTVDDQQYTDRFCFTFRLSK